MDVRTIEAPDDHRRVPHAEHLGDVRANRGGGGCRQSQHNRAADRLHSSGQVQVLGPKIVPPLRDAVRLVDDEQRRPGPAQLLEHIGAGELLGSQEQELDLAVLGLLERPLAGAPAERRVEHHRLGSFVALHRLHLVALERDQGRDHDRRPFEQHPGQLVDRRFARAGRHHAQRVGAADDRLDALDLAGTELLEPEPVAGEPSDAVARGGHRHSPDRRPRSASDASAMAPNTPARSPSSGATT